VIGYPRTTSDSWGRWLSSQVTQHALGTVFPSESVDNSPDWVSGGLLGITATILSGWSGALGTFGGSLSRSPGTWDMICKWGLLKQSQLTAQKSSEFCSGQRAWMWILIALDSSKTQFSPCRADAGPPASNRSPGPEWRTIFLLLTCPEYRQTSAVENVFHRNAFSFL
jgi:hypothetical protein